jgi:hypothetical protein
LHCAADYIDFSAISTSSHEACYLSFWELSCLARAAGSIVLGYVRPHGTGDDGKGCAEQRVVLNPPDKEALIRCPDTSAELEHSIPVMCVGAPDGSDPTELVYVEAFCFLPQIRDPQALPLPCTPPAH